MKNLKLNLESINKSLKNGYIVVKKNTARVVIGAVALVQTLSFTGCSNKNANTNNVTPTTTITQVDNNIKATPTVAPTSTPTPAPTEAPKAEVKNDVTSTPEPTKEVEDINVFEEALNNVKEFANEQNTSYEEYVIAYDNFIDKYINATNEEGKLIFDKQMIDAVMFYMNDGTLTDETLSQIIADNLLTNSYRTLRDDFGRFLNVYVNHKVNELLGKNTDGLSINLSDAIAKESDKKEALKYVEDLVYTIANADEKTAAKAYEQFFMTVYAKDDDLENEYVTDKFNKTGYNTVTSTQDYSVKIVYIPTLNAVVNNRENKGEKINHEITYNNTKTDITTFLGKHVANLVNPEYKEEDCPIIAEGRQYTR